MTSDDAAAVVQALALRTVLPANWAGGLADVRTAGVFVTPPVGGVVFATGADVRACHGDAALADRLAALSRRFGRAAWFCADGEADVFGWALAVRGTLQRHYEYTGEHGETVWHGEVTEAERALGCFLADPRDRSGEADAWWPDRRIVHALAAAWSHDPDALAAMASATGPGAVGRM